jgi:hypothetical protein
MCCTRLNYQCRYCIVQFFLKIKQSAAEPCVCRLPARHKWRRSCHGMKANGPAYVLGDSGTRVVFSRCGAHTADRMTGDSGFTSWQGQRFICPAQCRKWLWFRPSLWKQWIYSGWSMAFFIDLHLKLRLGMRGSRPSLLHTSSVRCTGTTWPS